MSDTGKEVEREILLAFWKVHILHHAGEEPIIGQWVVRELRLHGYEVSPGTLYPLLARMEDHGWLRSRVGPGGGPRAPKKYTLTRTGRSVLALLREQIEELYREVVVGEEDHGHKGAAAKPKSGSSRGAKQRLSAGRRRRLAEPKSR